MDITATAKYVRISPDKARDLAGRLKGLSVAQALRVTDFNARKGAQAFGKVLKSAIANAENNAKLSVDELRVKEAIVDVGPSSKRYWPRARGSAAPILKRTSHIKVVLSDGRDEAPAGA